MSSGRRQMGILNAHWSKLKIFLAEYFYLKENKSIMEYFFLVFTVYFFLGIQAYGISNGWLGPLSSRT